MTDNTDRLASVSSASAELEAGKDELRRLMDSIWRAEYRKEAPDWSPLEDLPGMVSQIDNMYAGVRGQRDQARWDLYNPSASPEPVPATNQGGEVERNLEAQRQTIEACACLVDRHPMRMDDNARMTLADAIRCLRPDESLAGDALDAKTADYNGHKPNRYLPEIPPGASLFAVNPSTGAWHYVNHAGTWQGMPNPLATQPATSLEADVDQQADDYAAEYVMTTEGNDYVPTEWERELIVDALHGFIADCWNASAPLSEDWRKALQPFADCVEQIDPAESDEEWAKFRLLIGDYRRAAAALATQPATSQEGARVDIDREDTWSDFFNDHMTDGNDGYRAADVIERCRAAFDAAWPNGWEAANAAGLASLAATPTPPTLSEDLREAAGALIQRMADRETDRGGCLDITAWLMEADRIAALAQVKAS